MLPGDLVKLRGRRPELSFWMSVRLWESNLLNCSNNMTNVCGELSHDDVAMIVAIGDSAFSSNKSIFIITSNFQCGWIDLWYLDKLQ